MKPESTRDVWQWVTIRSAQAQVKTFPRRHDTSKVNSIVARAGHLDKESGCCAGAAVRQTRRVTDRRAGPTSPACGIWLLILSWEKVKQSHDLNFIGTTKGQSTFQSLYIGITEFICTNASIVQWLESNESNFIGIEETSTYLYCFHRNFISSLRGERSVTVCIVCYLHAKTRLNQSGLCVEHGLPFRR